MRGPWEAFLARVHGSQGGASDVANLVLLCHRHHGTVHAGGGRWSKLRTGAWVCPGWRT
jgi:hypothetical protein